MKAVAVSGVFLALAVLPLAAARAADDVRLDVTIASEARRDVLADVVISYDGTALSDYDFLKIATADGIPLQSLPLGAAGTPAKGDWRLQVEADTYVVTWETADGTAEGSQEADAADAEAGATDETVARATRRFAVLLPPDEAPPPAVEAPAIGAPVDSMAKTDGRPAGEVRPSRRAGWSTYTNSRFGTRLSFPATVFALEPGEPRDFANGRRFSARSGEAVLETFAWENGKRETMAGLRARLLGQRGYERVTYRPTGAGWFVLSGFRGDRIFYEKYATRDGGQTVHAFAVEFPRALKPLYGALLEEIEDTFRAPG